MVIELDLWIRVCVICLINILIQGRNEEKLITNKFGRSNCRRLSVIDEKVFTNQRQHETSSSDAMYSVKGVTSCFHYLRRHWWS